MDVLLKGTLYLSTKNASSLRRASKKGVGKGRVEYHKQILRNGEYKGESYYRDNFKGTTLTN